MAIDTRLMMSVLNGINTGFAYLHARGLKHDKVLALLVRAEEEGRDISSDEVEEAISRAKEALDNLKAATAE